jgi:outer membrane protein assembly factor BamA
MFPRFIAPFLSYDFRRRINATSEVVLMYNLQNRPEYYRRVLSAAWKYKWNDSDHHDSYQIDLLDLNYVFMPWISSKFREDYLEDNTNRNAILRYNYEDLFIMKFGFRYNYNNGNKAIKANIETAGNLLGLLSNVAEFKKNELGQNKLFNIAYAQYVKADVDYTKYFNIDTRNTIVFHAGLGIAYPYGNSTILPFEKRYFSGGANSVRGWSVRSLGPGRYKGTDGNIDFINQTGDMKIDINLEYRTRLMGKLDGAIFVDAGNIWTLRYYDEQPGGQFDISTFYEELAVGYGVGLRLNFDFFTLRFDMGMKAVDPAYTGRKHYPILNHNFNRDFAFHFAVGMPF